MSHIDLASRYPGIFSNWRRLQQRTRRLQPHIPITTTGVLILIASLAALRGFGYQRMDLVVFALTVCALSIVLVSAVMVTVTGLLLCRRLAATMIRHCRRCRRRPVMQTKPLCSYPVTAGCP